MTGPSDATARAAAAKAALAKRLVGLPDVNGVGITRVGGEYAVKINLARPMTEALAGLLPKMIDGVRVVVEVVGPIVARGIASSPLTPPQLRKKPD